MNTKKSKKDVKELIDLQKDLIVPVITNNKSRDGIFNRLILENLDMTPKWNEFITNRFHTNTSLFQSISDFVKNTTDTNHTESDVLTSVIKFGFSKFIQSYLLSTHQRFQSLLQNDLKHVYGNQSTYLITDHLSFVSDMFEMFTQMNMLKHENTRTLHTISILNLANEDIWMNLGDNGYDAIKVQKSKNGLYLDENHNEIQQKDFLDCLYYTVTNKNNKNILKRDNPNIHEVLLSNKNIEIKTIESAKFAYEIPGNIKIPATSFLDNRIQLSKTTPKAIIKENYDAFVIAIAKKYNQAYQFILFNDGNQKRKLRNVVKQTRQNYRFYDDICANQNIKPINYYSSANIPLWEFLLCGMWRVYNTKTWLTQNKNKIAYFSIQSLMAYLYGMSEEDLKQNLANLVTHRFKHWFKLYLSAISIKKIVASVNIDKNIGAKLENTDDKIMFANTINLINTQMNVICDYYNNLFNGLFTYEELNNLKINAMTSVLKEKQISKHKITKKHKKTEQTNNTKAQSRKK